MSGQWEVVGKGKKDKHNNKKLTKTEKKKFVDNAPKVEDLLPLSQVKSLYSALDTSKENEPNKPTEKAVKTKENEAKKTQKKQQPEKKKEKEPVKEKPPKNLEAAVSLLKLSEISALIDIGKENFKGTPLVWLKGLASYVNVILAFDHRETNFSTKSFDHPLCLLPSDIRNLIKKEIKQVSEHHSNIVQALFDCCLTSMAVDMAKGSHVSGFKMLLQLLATQYPAITVANLEKYVTLRNSYQNKQAIGFSILWALGQGGYRDLSSGLKVWQTVMLPLCEMRPYTRYVLDYIKVLLARHTTSKALGSEQYFSIIDSIYSPDLKLSNPASVELKSHAKQLREIACNLQPEKKLHLYFQQLLDRISSSTNPLKDDLVRFSVSCLTNDQQTFSIWKNSYADNLPQSACILKNINSDLNSVLEKVSKKELLNTILSFNSVNNSMIRKNQKGAGLQDCNRLCEALLRKMSSKKSSFSLFKILFFVFLTFAAIISFDIHVHGSFKASSSGRFAKDIGVYPHVETAISYTKTYYNRAHKWSVKNVPVYYKIAADSSRPYFVLISEYATIAFKHVRKSMNNIWAYVADKLPFISQWVETYAPGLSKKEFWSNIFDNVAHYSEVFSRFCLTIIVEGLFYFMVALEVVVTWLQKNVFVGNLSPENLQKYAIQGIDTALNFTTKAIFWVQEKFASIYG